MCTSARAVAALHAIVSFSYKTFIFTLNNINLIVANVPNGEHAIAVDSASVETIDAEVGAHIEYPSRPQHLSTSGSLSTIIFIEPFQASSDDVL
jgi:hypothetical protein